MAINKRATNICIQIKKEYKSFAGKIDVTAKKVFVHSTDNNLLISSNKKIITHGNE